jgi:predicted methyltransferase MtxX (methanogen marker protein 4)
VLGRIEELSRDAHVRIGIGIASPGDAADATARAADGPGPGPVELFGSAGELVNALVSGAIDGAVRGTLPAHDVLPPLLSATRTGSADRAALLDLGEGRCFLLAPVGIDEGRDLRERWRLLKGAARALASLGIEPRAAVMSMGRNEDGDRGEAIAVSLRECEALRDAATAQGITATCTGIRLERAVAEANLVIAPDGVSGNLVFRSLHLVAGFQSWGAVSLGVAPLVFVDTSREKGDYTGALHLARALVASRALRWAHR